jgi:hypothetical protein
MTKVKRSEVMDALEYFHGAGYIEQLRSDEQYYVNILMNFAAQRCQYRISIVRQ